MLRNHLTESDLEGYAAAISELLYTGQTDYSAQKEKATQFVFNQLIQKRYDVKQLMPELYLRENGTVINSTAAETSAIDTISRLRLVIDNITNTSSSKAITLQGSSDNITFKDVTAVTVTTTDTSKAVTFFDTYKYYRIKVTVNSGTIDYRAYLTETVYDDLFAYKWLVFIYADISKSEGDQYDKKMNQFEMMYNDLMNNAILYIDSNSDGIPDSVRETNVINITR